MSTRVDLSDPMPEEFSKLAAAEELQWVADTIRLMKQGLRTHEPLTMQGVWDRIAERYSPEMANQWICEMITHLMFTEDWSFFNEETGEASPLL